MLRQRSAPAARFAGVQTQSSSLSAYSGSSCRRPKKKIYHREPELDRAMDLRKKPSLLLRLRSLIISRKSQSLLLRDLEKEVGFVQKWNYLAAIERFPTIFRVSGGDRKPISVSLTNKAQQVSNEERCYRELMEPVLVKNLKKMLMLSIDCRVPLESIQLVESDLGLPQDFENSIIVKYPEAFSIKDVDGRRYLCLESWDSSLAVTVREERLNLRDGNLVNWKVLARDGNYNGPFAFKLKYPAGFRPNKGYLEEVRRWQKMEFPSPYLNARRVDRGTPKARKRAVAVLHEILSLMMEKKLTSDKLDAFHHEYQLPSRLLLCLVKHHGMFYLTNKGEQSTVFLKEAYHGSELIEKCPLLRFNEKFVSLIGRQCNSVCSPLLV